ncbi:uncharacterized protein LAESUDRAFT_729559 [Laetiporus sulphureus 93-53]|uniref:Uncharacterized protein n=1 Tax=Laetiporus sulphureus 93-53 TaxID=1314785 RepID=A0A165CLZ5_9APHY|nr:uncharacterized protein LAESUDRAFT_729559 [Laetiporus sulphureus 93-53]KZT03049.1 hypothetical protein LAESUDRAFT_729559 [Laetiporus sulphureus 93-53]
MATWIDYISLALTLSIFAGIALGLIHFRRATSKVVDATKESLKSKGVNVSSQGISVKMQKRLDRENYLDATQRGLMRAYNNSTYGPDKGVSMPSHSAESLPLEHESATAKARDRLETFSGAIRNHRTKKSPNATP